VPARGAGGRHGLREFFLARYCYHFLLLEWASAAALFASCAARISVVAATNGIDAIMPLMTSLSRHVFHPLWD